MDTYADALTTTAPTIEGMMKTLREFERRDKIRKTIDLAKREGVVYVGPGVENADLAEFLPGVEVRHVPYMENGQIAALDTTCLKEFGFPPLT